MDQNVARLDSRYYPLGSETAQILGDWRTAENFHATNTSFIERDSNTKLQGYSDYDELAPFIRYRHAPAMRTLNGCAIATVTCAPPSTRVCNSLHRKFSGSISTKRVWSMERS